MGVKWVEGKLTTNIRKLDRKTRTFLYASCALNASRAESYARKNAPWTDRTSNARNGLIARHFKDGNTFGVIVAGTVDYQIFLEVRWSGRYAIIRPTLAHTAPALMKTISSGWGRAVGGAM